MNNSDVNASWLHISDLHLFAEADTITMLDSYRDLAAEIAPGFLIAAGDFRHIVRQRSFKPAQIYIKKILGIFNLTYEDLFMIPGNHDINQLQHEDVMIGDICSNVPNDYNLYVKYMSGQMSLKHRFNQYKKFVEELYQDSDVADARVNDPAGIYAVLWKQKVNILGINTAIISDDQKHGQIVDIRTLAGCNIDNTFPTIMIGHHDINEIYASHAKRMEYIIDQKKISAYLHGDKHIFQNKSVRKISLPNRSIPSISCGKSAPQSGDTFSNIGVIYYEWRKDGNVYVYPYSWDAYRGFVESNAFSYEINKHYYFPMVYGARERSGELYRIIGKKTLDRKDFMDGQWKKEAEEIWDTYHHEGIGRILLLYYCTRKENGDIGSGEKLRTIFRQLEGMDNKDSRTEHMLEQAKSLL